MAMRETNSREVAASDAISSDATCTPGLRGIALTTIVQLAPRIRVEQLDWTAKSGVAVTAAMWMVTLPVFVSVMLCGGDTLPTGVTGKLSEPCELV